MKRVAVWLILLLAFIGLADSSYLAKESVLGDPLICDIAGLTGCNVVAQSPYSRLWGIPLATFGVGFYILLFILAAVEVAYQNLQIRRALQVIAALGLMASAYFVFVQLTIIDALCVYCMISGGISFLVFLLAYGIEPFARGVEPMRSPEHKRGGLILPPPLT